MARNGLQTLARAELLSRIIERIMAEQHWNPETYARNARFVSDLGEPLLELLKPVAEESILDLGCGDGALTLAVAAKSGRAIVSVRVCVEIASREHVERHSARIRRHVPELESRHQALQAAPRHARNRATQNQTMSLVVVSRSLFGSDIKGVLGRAEEGVARSGERL